VSPSSIIVLAGSSDIGSHLALRFRDKGAKVVATYRSYSEKIDKMQAAGISTYPLDLSSADQLAEFCNALRSENFSWDAVISSSGQLRPIGPFFSLDFDEWQQSVITNSLDQLRAIHALYGVGRADLVRKVIFFAGGGTNGPMDNYSAYCVGKITLIKMAELLHSEYSDLQVTSIGTGWVKTKIHDQTLAAGEKAGANYARTQNVLGGTSETHVTSLEDVMECIDWCLSARREAVGGRNFSLVHDRWRDEDFVERLETDPNSHKLRRIEFDNKFK